MDISSLMKENAAALMPALEENLKTPDESLETLYSAMRYSALSPVIRKNIHLPARLKSETGEVLIV